MLWQKQLKPLIRTIILKQCIIWMHGLAYTQLEMNLQTWKFWSKTNTLAFFARESMMKFLNFIMI